MDKKSDQGTNRVSDFSVISSTEQNNIESIDKTIKIYYTEFTEDLNKKSNTDCEHNGNGNILKPIENNIEKVTKSPI